MRVRIETARHDVVAARTRRGASAPAAILRAIRLERRALDEAVARDGHHHLARLDQALVVLVRRIIHDRGETRRRNLAAHSHQLVAHDLHATRPAGDNLQQLTNALGNLAQFRSDLLGLQPGKPLQPQLQDTTRLRLRQTHTVFDDDVAAIVDQRQQSRHVAGRPVARHQCRARGRRIGARAYQPDYLVDIGDRNRQPDQQMRPLARLGQLIPATPKYHLLAEIHEAHQQLAQAHRTRPATIQRQHVARETDLHVGETEKLVQHHFAGSIALQLDHHPHALPVALVANIRNALDLLGAHQLRNALLQRRLVHLIRQLGDDDRLAILAHLLELATRAQNQRTAPGLERATYARAPDDQPAGRKIRRRHDRHQLVERGRRLGNQRQRRIDDLARIMRRNTRGHSHGDALRAVDQQRGIRRRQNHRLLRALVVIRLEIDGILVDIGQHEHAGRRQPHFGVAHRRRRIAIDGPEITLPIDQRQPDRERLRHAHSRVVDRTVAMRMVTAHHVADDLSALAIRLVWRIARLVHAIQDAPVHRLQPVARIGQRPADDHRHGISEVGALHLLLERHRLGVAGPARRDCAGWVDRWVARWIVARWFVSRVAQSVLLSSIAECFLHKRARRAKLPRRSDRPRHRRRANNTPSANPAAPGWPHPTRTAPRRPPAHPRPADRVAAPRRPPSRDPRRATPPVSPARRAGAEFMRSVSGTGSARICPSSAPIRPPSASSARACARAAGSCRGCVRDGGGKWSRRKAASVASTAARAAPSISLTCARTIRSSARSWFSAR